MVGIYMIENLLNGKVYIGSSTDIKKRWWFHKGKLNRKIDEKHENLKLQADWDEYGSRAFEFRVLEKCNPCDLDEYETKWIQYYQSYKTEYGYNLSLP